MMIKTITRTIIIVVVIHYGCSSNKVTYNDFVTMKSEILQNSYGVLLDDKLLANDTVDFYFRFLTKDLVSEIEFLPTKLKHEYGISDSLKVLHVKSIVYPALINRDINYFKSNFTDAIWIVNGKPMLAKGKILEDELATHLENITKDNITSIAFIFPDIAKELYGFRTSGGIVILKTTVSNGEHQ